MQYLFKPDDEAMIAHFRAMAGRDRHAHHHLQRRAVVLPLAGAAHADHDRGAAGGRRLRAPMPEASPVQQVATRKALEGLGMSGGQHFQAAE
ncbi:hypothetical protein QA640_25860 [Bradyrhizobium sp. CB82]|uniref:hypothetical protein n=1 Tax=Bradyrhizobium sp. CB82 TaxID=3039159 RepID=UPI0024B03CB5|nr:hypothetical protein [Bradyrhizobium sp. CB82]WFU37876.1 hypothetical protein QA640_25860 [Bradyrhizobium sp. CB82]